MLGVIVGTNLFPSLWSFAIRSWSSSRIYLYLSPFIVPSILTSRPVPAAEKHLHSMMMPQPCFTVRKMSCVWVFFRHGALHSGHFLCSQTTLFGFWSFLFCKLQVCCRAFFSGVTSVWSLSQMVKCCRDFSWQVLSSWPMNSVVLSEWSLGSWSPPWPRSF
jgi:hypothetical protein